MKATFLVGILLFSTTLSAQDEVDTTQLRSMLRHGEFTAVAAQVGPLLKMDPANATLWIVQGLAQRGQGMTADSLASFRRALILAPGNATALRGSAEAAFSLHDERAKDLVQEILTAVPDDPVANAMAGSLAFDRGDCSVAISYFTRAGELLHSNKGASLQASHCYVLADNAGKAVQILDALPDAQTSPEVIYDLASAQFYAGRYEQSIASLEKLHAKKPEIAEVSNLLGANYDKLGRAPEALSAYQRACEQSPDVPDYYIDLARFAMEHSSADAALKVLNAGVARNPTSAAMLTVRGSIYAYQGDSAKAETDFAMAEKVDPTSSYGRVGRSLQLRDQGMSGSSEEVLRAELRQHPADTEVKLFLAEDLLNSPSMDKKNEAAGLLGDVLKVRPEDVSALLAYAKLLMTRDEYTSALPLLQLAQKHDPESAAVLNRLLLTYRKLNMRQESAATADRLRKVVDSDRDQELRRNRFQITAENR